ncbi:MAG: hypothetical protein U9Q15_04730 [Patescibacteria group bacterium]|nr:hypothetical protein [Patescibacteria group bacterium]
MQIPQHIQEESTTRATPKQVSLAEPLAEGKYSILTKTEIKSKNTLYPLKYTYMLDTIRVEIPMIQFDMTETNFKHLCE